MSVTPFPSPSPVRVLLLEDTEIDAHVMETVLRQHAFRVRRTAQLADALIAIRSDEFDVILSDLGLPDSSGLATLEELRQHAPATPVVVITGRDDESTALRAVAAGAQDYLVKGSTDANALVRSIRYAVERGRATEEISVSEARMRTILEEALDAVVTINQEGLIVRWNRSAEEIFGRPRSEVLGRPIAELIIPERFRHAHQRAMRAFFDTGDASSMGKRVEWVALRSDGSEFPVEVRITAEGDSSGMTFTAFISDITERRRAEEERIAAEAKFRALVEHAARVESLGRVSAFVAHEFNNLLMAVGPFAEVLRRKALDDPSLERPVRHVVNAVRRGQRLTAEILRFTNPVEPCIEPINLAALVADLADEARGVLQDRKLAIDVPDRLETCADGDQLAQVLLNLVTNARDATRGGGLVTIGVAPALELPFLREHLADAAQFVAFYVRDNGCGISAEARQRIFEPFFTTGKRNGNGLGLAVAFRIVASHGGHILCESEEGAGTTFYVALPAGPS